MKITEIYSTIQGEGKYVGLPIIVLRTGICNLQCDFCDTKYSWQKEFIPNLKNISTLKDADQIINEIEEKRNNIDTILLTGGEPMLWQNDYYFGYILNNLIKNNMKIHVETNGTMKLIKSELFEYISISPKTTTYFDLYQKEVIETYKNFKDKIFKFVVGDLTDIISIKNFYRKFEIKDNDIWLMPKGTTQEELQNSLVVIDKYKDLFDNCSISERRHILLHVR